MEFLRGKFICHPRLIHSNLFIYSFSFKSTYYVLIHISHSNLLYVKDAFCFSLSIYQQYSIAYSNHILQCQENHGTYILCTILRKVDLDTDTYVVLAAQISRMFFALLNRTEYMFRKKLNLVKNAKSGNVMNQLPISKCKVICNKYSHKL